MQKNLFSALAFVVALASGQVYAYSSLVVFGDSLSDNGNLYSFTSYLSTIAGSGVTSPSPPPPYWDGRFSNGPVAVERMAQDMGIPLYDFAYGGAKTGPNGGSDFNGALGGLGLGLLGQVGSALPAVQSNPAKSSALYVLWAGPNDFFTGGSVNTAVDNMTMALTQLHDNGAEHFFVPLMPDLGLTPAARAQGTAAQTFLSGLTDSYNGALMFALSGVVPAGAITFYDTATFLRQTVNSLPAQFANVTDQCILNSACLASDGQGYLFWDSVHPTAAAHMILGDAFAAAVPEPETYAMMLMGLGLLGIVARRRKQLAS